MIRGKTGTGETRGKTQTQVRRMGKGAGAAPHAVAGGQRGRGEYGNERQRRGADAYGQKETRGRTTQDHAGPKQDRRWPDVGLRMGVRAAKRAQIEGMIGAGTAADMIVRSVTPEL